MRHASLLWVTVAISLITVLGASPVAAPTHARLPLVLYGTDEELGGHFPLAELVLGKATPLADDVATQIKLRTTMTVSRLGDAEVSLDPHQTPVLLLTTAGSAPISSALGQYIRDGGFLVCAPQDDESGQQIRQWARLAFPNEPLMELPPEHLARGD